MSTDADRIRLLRQWVEKAEHDLRTGEHTLTLLTDCPFDTIAFHMHQCVEKYLKAFLYWREVEFPRTHDRRSLLQLTPSSLRENLDPVAVIGLNRYVIEGRYPGDWDPITRADAEAAIAVARFVRNAVKVLLPIEA